MFYSSLNKREKTTFNIYVLYAIIEGVVTGITLLNEYVFLRSLKASENLIGILFLLSVVVYFILFISNEITRRIKNKKKLLKYTGILSRLPLLGFILFPTVVNNDNSALLHLLFLLIMFLYYLGTAITLPTINQLLKHNFRNNNFGKLYGYASTANKIATMFATMLFGLLLDVDYFSFRYVYPIMGIFGICSFYMLSLIPFNSRNVYVKENFFKSISTSLRRMIKILNENKAFRDFEIAYFSYGTGYMFSTTVVTFFLESYLNLSYSMISGYKTLAGIITFLTIPLFGIIMDKIDQRRFSFYMFLFMLLYLVFVLLTLFIPIGCSFGNDHLYYIFLVFAFVMYGFFSASGTLSWNVGTAYFSKDASKVADFHAVHITLTGLRGLLAPLGVVIYKQWGYGFTFGISLFFVFVALIIIEVSLKKK